MYGDALLAMNGVPPVGRLGIDTEVRDAGRRGLGLFALRDFGPEEIVARYSGVIASEDEYREAFYSGLTGGDYIANADADGLLVVDADSPDSGPARFVNHSRLWQNCRFYGLTLGDDDWPTGLVYVRTVRPVRAGDEFLVDYGDAYWDSGVRKKPTPWERIAIDYLP